MTIVIDGCSYTGDARAAFEAAKGGKVKRGEDIAKTTARRATEAERWRYGVELRIIGSRWRPQTRAPHYPAPEPYVYRKATQGFSWRPYRVNGNLSLAEEYEAWMADRDKPQAPPPAPKPKEPDPWAAAPTRNVVAFPAPVREAPAPGIYIVPDRKTAAAELLREIAGNYGPRRAHKLRAMADWLEGKPAVGKIATGG